MPLEEIDFSPPEIPIPAEVEAYLQSMVDPIEHFRTKTPGSFRGYVPSDYSKFYVAMTHLVERRLACGSAFCEWGSGLGISTCLASMLGFDSVGIEIDNRLVQAAEELASEQGLDVEFALGSFLPDGVDDLIDEAFADNEGEISMIIQSDDAYQQLGRELDEFDLVFCFPWPTDESVTAEIFERFACNGAILLTFDEGEGYQARRKIP